MLMNRLPHGTTSLSSMCPYSFKLTYTLAFGAAEWTVRYPRRRRTRSSATSPDDADPVSLTGDALAAGGSAAVVSGATGTDVISCAATRGSATGGSADGGSFAREAR